MLTETMPPLFLSPAAHREALRIFEVFEREDGPSIRQAIDRAVMSLSGGDWSAYDDTYLSLYTLSLFGHGKALPLMATPDPEGLLPHRESVQFMLDMDLCPNTNAHRLLDERGVADFINFRRAVEGLIPFQMSPRSVGFGCIMIEFEVMVPGLGDLDAHGDGFVSSFFAGKEWEDLTRRFNVAEVAVHGST